MANPEAPNPSYLGPVPEHEQMVLYEAPQPPAPVELLPSGEIAQTEALGDQLPNPYVATDDYEEVNGELVEDSAPVPVGPGVSGNYDTSQPPQMTGPQPHQTGGNSGNANQQPPSGAPQPPVPHTPNFDFFGKNNAKQIYDHLNDPILNHLADQDFGSSGEHVFNMPLDPEFDLANQFRNALRGPQNPNTPRHEQTPNPDRAELRRLGMNALNAYVKYGEIEKDYEIAKFLSDNPVEGRNNKPITISDVKKDRQISQTLQDMFPEFKAIMERKLHKDYKALVEDHDVGTGKIGGKLHRHPQEDREKQHQERVLRAYEDRLTQHGIDPSTIKGITDSFTDTTRAYDAALKSVETDSSAPKPTTPPTRAEIREGQRVGDLKRGQLKRAFTRDKLAMWTGPYDTNGPYRPPAETPLDPIKDAREIISPDAAYSGFKLPFEEGTSIFGQTINHQLGSAKNSQTAHEASQVKASTMGSDRQADEIAALDTEGRRIPGTKIHTQRSKAEAERRSHARADSEIDDLQETIDDTNPKGRTARHLGRLVRRRLSRP